MFETDTRVDAPDENEIPPEEGDEGAPSGQEEPRPSTEPSERERELERRLTDMGRRNAELSRTTSALLQQTRELKATVTEIVANQTEQQQDAAKRREAERQAYLEALPPERRTAEEVRLLREEMAELKRVRTAVPPEQTATTRASVDQDPDVEYAKQRARQIVDEANAEFGVTLTQEHLQQMPQSAWGDEDAFFRETMKLAAKVSRGQGATEVPKKEPSKQETPEEMEARITARVKESLGVSSPASPRAAAARGKRPTEEDVRATVNTYDSKAGPKANIAKLKEQRARMG